MQPQGADSMVTREARGVYCGTQSPGKKPWAVRRKPKCPRLTPEIPLPRLSAAGPTPPGDCKNNRDKGKDGLSSGDLANVAFVAHH